MLIQPDISLPVPPEAAPVVEEGSLLKPPWEILQAEEERIIEIPELPTRKRLIKKQFKVDRRTEVSLNQFRNAINNPQRLSRSLERAPATRELLVREGRE
eukprot:TRINITY_DN6929_c0_g1_i1.p1 TRINITY_DN6929_c0_g1~~TRINITY_DN6929_c0_g1_i1.p1  ORF type:complete len:100 (-),score=31.16 TRINITY_DN6929_c0_g1_i1:735-1034(-)